jgi:hypothetical protein
LRARAFDVVPVLPARCNLFQPVEVPVLPADRRQRDASAIVVDPAKPSQDAVPTLQGLPALPIAAQPRLLQRPLGSDQVVKPQHRCHSVEERGRFLVEEGAQLVVEEKGAVSPQGRRPTQGLERGSRLPVDLYLRNRILERRIRRPTA